MKTHPQSHRARRRPGFTLIELLVVIVIIAVLASIGFAVAGRAKSKAKSMQCLQNLRDWSVVFSSAAADRSGRLPTPQNWAAISHQPYDPNSDSPGRAPFVDYWDSDIEQAFATQLEKRACPCLEEGSTPGGNRAPTYMMNWRLSQAPRYLEMNMATVQRASRKVFFLDGNVGSPLRLNGKTDIVNHSIPAAESHGGRINVVFADLHVEPINPKEIADDWDGYALPAK